MRFTQILLATFATGLISKCGGGIFCRHCAESGGLNLLHILSCLQAQLGGQEKFVIPFCRALARRCLVRWPSPAIHCMVREGKGIKSNRLQLFESKKAAKSRLGKIQRLENDGPSGAGDLERTKLHAHIWYIPRRQLKTAPQAQYCHCHGTRVLQWTS